jgi:hypothetical protein
VTPEPECSRTAYLKFSKCSGSTENRSLKLFKNFFYNLKLDAEKLLECFRITKVRTVNSFKMFPNDQSQNINSFKMFQNSQNKKSELEIFSQYARTTEVRTAQVRTTEFRTRDYMKMFQNSKVRTGNIVFQNSRSHNNQRQNQRLYENVSEQQKSEQYTLQNVP